MFHKINWTTKKIAQRIKIIEPLVYRQQVSLAPFQYHVTPGPKPVSETEIPESEWIEIHPGTYWGDWLANFILRGRFTAPAAWESQGPVALYLPIGEAGDFSHPEALVSIDGSNYATCDRHHQEIILPSDWINGKEHSISMQGWIGLMEGDPLRKPLMRPCAVVQIDQPTRDFVAKARVTLGIAENLEENNPVRSHLLTSLDEAFKVLDLREPFENGFYESIQPASEVLQAGIDASGIPLDVDITAVGHAHIDVAWLWTIDQTRGKARRTFYNVLRNMDRFPGYHFTQSQPQLFDFIREDDPTLFEKVKERIQEGRWEPIGGMWVEADCNLTGPESLARQFLLGVRFYKEQFGEHAASPVLWLPDVFGYAWNLPQLIKEAGLEYFFTIKIGWSQYNRLPYDSFWWQGLDGTRVLTHFSPTTDEGMFAATYNGNASPRQTIMSWNNFQQKDAGRPGVTPPILMSYGHGDGGGGPTPEMIENIRELVDFPGAPRVHYGKAGDFFKQLEKTVGDRLPVWNGELYLEYHRGTYTTQARTKRANRKTEFLLHDTEFLAAMAEQIGVSFRYPSDQFTRIWRTVATNQFHDILPGSSIGPVYENSSKDFDQVQKEAMSIRDSAAEAIARTTGGDLLLINPTSFWRNDLVFWQDGQKGSHGLQRLDGSQVIAQAVDHGVLLDVGELPPYSVTVLQYDPPNPNAIPQDVAEMMQVTPELLENAFLRVELNRDGDITRIYDKQNDREVLPKGKIGNQLQAFEDRPLDFDAWDIDIFYEEKQWFADPAEAIEVVEAGPLRVAIEVRRKILNSTLVQKISLSYNSPRLDFDTKIEWRERHILLKTAFPVEVLSPKATYEIQWGNVERSTHRNTSWDWARFETCAHKWVDLSEGNYGVSLLNDCKYGHDIKDNVIRLSLLRGPTMPDIGADMGEHAFSYSLLPHSGGWNEETAAAAYRFNDPTFVWKPTMTADHEPFEPESLITTDCGNIIIETIKKAEDGNGIIVRLYEFQRKRGKVTLKTGFTVQQAWSTNILEENKAPIETTGRQVTFSIQPYQILTLRLVPATEK